MFFLVLGTIFWKSSKGHREHCVEALSQLGSLAMAAPHGPHFTYGESEALGEFAQRDEGGEGRTLNTLTYHQTSLLVSYWLKQRSERK